MSSVEEILDENRRRNAEIKAVFNPVTGEGAILQRKKIVISDFPIPEQWVPLDMMYEPIVSQLVEAGSITEWMKEMEIEDTEKSRTEIIKTFIRIRIRYDFCFWAILYVLIKNKLGGEDIHFRLNRPQRRLIEKFEEMRLARKPIRLILLKARQWGGSTATQIYIAWLQIVHKKGLNSLIVAHVKDASAEVKGMFDKMLDSYPIEMLHELGEAFDPNEPKVVGIDGTTNIKYIPQRNCKIKIGTAERPDSARGGDSALVHCTEVAFWKKTEGKTPEQIIRSATSGVANLPLTMIVYESTANGTGGFFHREYEAARKGESMFVALFIAWFEIERYSMPFASEEEKIEFAKWLFLNKDNSNVPNSRQESGRYLWRLWELGATLEAINWYIFERRKYEDHADMAAEYPSDDIEAFKHSGERVFDQYKVENFRAACRPPKFVGDVYADGDEGEDALKNLRFSEDRQGQLWVWQKPELFENERVLYRYLVVVDVGGRSKKADWSVITVFDRYWMMDGGKPTVVAQWYGHTDHDILAWKSVQIAAWYDNALLVIESNTLETKDKERDVDGDQTSFILNQIKDVYSNLYARKQSEEDILQGIEKKYGWHTNVSTKPMIISFLVKVIREQLYVERDERCLDEYITYEKKPNGAFGAIIGKHDDLLMTRAIGLHICYREMELPKIITIMKVMHAYNKKVVSEATI